MNTTYEHTKLANDHFFLCVKYIFRHSLHRFRLSDRETYSLLILQKIEVLHGQNSGVCSVSPVTWFPETTAILKHPRSNLLLRLGDLEAMNLRGLEKVGERMGEMMQLDYN